MKKYLSLLMIAAAITLSFTSCKEKEPEKAKLDNTTWEFSMQMTANEFLEYLADEIGVTAAELSAAGITVDACSSRETVNFIDGTKGIIDSSSTGKIYQNGQVLEDLNSAVSTNFTYTYTEPNGTITVENTNFNFVVKGNIMTVTFPNGTQDYTKK
jgi:hypothetical protein